MWLSRTPMRQMSRRRTARLMGHEFSKRTLCGVPVSRSCFYREIERRCGGAASPRHRCRRDKPRDSGSVKGCKKRNCIGFCPPSPRFTARNTHFEPEALCEMMRFDEFQHRNMQKKQLLCISFWVFWLFEYFVLNFHRRADRVGFVLTWKCRGLTGSPIVTPASSWLFRF